MLSIRSTKSLRSFQFSTSEKNEQTNENVYMRVAKSMAPEEKKLRFSRGKIIIQIYRYNSTTIVIRSFARFFDSEYFFFPYICQALSYFFLLSFVQFAFGWFVVYVLCGTNGNTKRIIINSILYKLNAFKNRFCFAICFLWKLAGKKCEHISQSFYYLLRF